MNTNTNSTKNHLIREALIDFALIRPPTHWVTLNTHRLLSDDAATGRLKRWRVEMLRRLHGQHFYRLPASDLFQFTGSRERTQMDEPHFHLACAVPAQLTERFLRHATQRWKAITPSGTCHIEPVDDDPDSPRRILGYAFKQFDSTSGVPFVDSRLFR